VLAVIGILGALAGAAGYFNANYAKSRIAALNGDLEEQDRRYDTLKQDYTALELRLNLETKAREDSDNKVAVLEKVVTGAKELEEIAGILRTHDERAKNIESIVTDLFEHGVRVKDEGNRRHG
jgi:predicted  nucleic acid-binding Zn-ribbon protein